MSFYKYGRDCEPEIISAADLYKKAINYQHSDINKLVKHQTEKIRHFQAKATLFFLLREIRHDVVTEFKIEGIGTGDLLDITARIQYEVETEKSIANINKAKEKYLQAKIDLIIIQIKKMPNDINEISEFLKPYIRPQ
jgi:hypothetical protein